MYSFSCETTGAEKVDKPQRAELHFTQFLSTVNQIVL